MALSSGPINRETTSPFHLKLFYKVGSFHSLTDFPLPLPLPTPTAPTPTTLPSTHLPPTHLQIYTWPTCTLRELSHLLVSALPSLIPSPAIGTRLAFRLLYPDQGRGGWGTKELGSLIIGVQGNEDERLKDEEEEGKDEKVLGGKLQGDAGKTLAEAKFIIGDFVDVGIFPPGRDGEIASGPVGGGRGRGAPRGGGFGGRENGFPTGGGGGGYGGYAGGGGGYRGDGRGRGGFGGGGFGAGRGERVPEGEWRRGERLPDTGFRGGGGGYRGRGRGW